MKQKEMNWLMVAIPIAAIIILIVCIICFWPGRNSSQNQKEPVTAGESKEKENGDAASSDFIGNEGEQEDGESYDSLFEIDSNKEANAGGNDETGTKDTLTDSVDTETKDKNSGTDGMESTEKEPGKDGAGDTEKEPGVGEDVPPGAGEDVPPGETGSDDGTENFEEGVDTSNKYGPIH